MNMITFSTCFYILRSKVPPTTYVLWMNNFLQIVNNFNLVIYTNAETCRLIDTKGNPRIKVVLKELENFHTFSLKNNWINNHEKNKLLNKRVQWEVNMLWSEKIFFVYETVQQQYFASEFYGWCDIGYFRNTEENTHTYHLQMWPNPEKVEQLNREKIYYGCISNNDRYLKYLNDIVKNKNANGLPCTPIPAKQNSIAGNFFLLHKHKISWWVKTYYDKLNLYFQHNYLVKDDQIILLDCIFTNISEFVLIKENVKHLDNWFLFQRFFM